MDMEVVCPYLLWSGVLKIRFPLTPTSKMTIFPIDVPIAKNLFPLEDIQVGIPTPFVYDLFISKSYVTFFKVIQTILRIFYGPGIGKPERRAHLCKGFDYDNAKLLCKYIPQVLKLQVEKFDLTPLAFLKQLDLRFPLCCSFFMFLIRKMANLSPQKMHQSFKFLISFRRHQFLNREVIEVCLIG